MKPSKHNIDQISDEFGSTFSFVSTTKTGFIISNFFHRENNLFNSTRAVKKVLGENTKVEYQQLKHQIYNVIITESE